MIRSVFISRDLQDCPQLAIFCEENKIELQAKSLISFEEVKSNYTIAPDIIFFSSIRTVEYFLKNHKLRDGILIACIGQSTAAKIEKLGLRVDFIGENAGDPNKVGIDFKQWANGRKVLIPCSSISNQSISTHLTKDTYEEIYVYHTESSPVLVHKKDVYIFSSPSNFKSFLALNTLPENSIIVAWGLTTEKAIHSAGFKVDHVLKQSTEEELIYWLQKK